MELFLEGSIDYTILGWGKAEGEVFTLGPYGLSNGMLIVGNRNIEIPRSLGWFRFAWVVQAHVISFYLDDVLIVQTPALLTGKMMTLKHSACYCRIWTTALTPAEIELEGKLRRHGRTDDHLANFDHREDPLWTMHPHISLSSQI